MSELILTSYLENGELKDKIVKDSEEFWSNVINNFKKEVGPNIRQSTIDGFRRAEIGFAERILEHIVYWIIAKEKNVNYNDSKAKHRHVWESIEKLNLHQRLSMALPYIAD